MQTYETKGYETCRMLLLMCVCVVGCHQLQCDAQVAQEIDVVCDVIEAHLNQTRVVVAPSQQSTNFIPTPGVLQAHMSNKRIVFVKNVYM